MTGCSSVGRRIRDTGFGGRIDLLAIAPDGSLILIELKRNRTPREVVAKALDYASWVEKLRVDEISVSDKSQLAQTIVYATIHRLSQSPAN